MSIVEFLLARIAEDEEDPWRGAELVGSDRIVGTAEQKALEEEEREWVARILAECAAKRAIVEAFEGTDLEDCWDFQATPLKALATIYADHPDYRKEWKP